MFFTDSFISNDLKSVFTDVKRLISKLKKDFFPLEIPLVRKSKSTIFLSKNIFWSSDSVTEFFISLPKLLTTRFQLWSSFFGVTHDCMLI